MRHLLNRNRLLSELRLRLNENPVTALLGARQTGKTTLAKMLMQSFPQESTLFDLENPAMCAALEQTPLQVLKGCKGLVVIDEIQRMPELFNILRPLCDDVDGQRTFLLLGSASPDIVKGVSESLAGRVSFLNVSGFSLEECGLKNKEKLWLQGGFPRAYLGSEERAFRWLDDFSRTFLERDIPQLGLRIPALTLRRFWLTMSHYHGQTWNAAEVGRVFFVGPSAANHYRDILSGAYMLYVLPPWFENIKKRQVKSPKVYFRDTGLLHSFLGVRSMEELRCHPKYGASWEGFSLMQLLMMVGERDAYFWSTQRGAELDLLLMRRGGRYGFEFKCTDSPVTTRSMHVAMQDLKLDHLWVVYPGDLRFEMSEGMTALPLKCIYELDKILES